VPLQDDAAESRMIFVVYIDHACQRGRGRKPDDLRRLH
jgi:hypothetical protein